MKKRKDWSKTFHVTKGGEKWLCSGYGVYPGGEKCKGCMDCEGKYLKQSITNKQVKENFNSTHAIVSFEKAPKFLSKLLKRKK